MSRAKGTFVTADRWVSELAPRLPGSAGWALLELSYQSNYDEKGLTVPDLQKKLGKSQTTCQDALTYLVGEDHALLDVATGSYYLRGISVELSQAFRRKLGEKWARNNGQHGKPQPTYPWITGVNRKIEGIEKGKASLQEELAGLPDQNQAHEGPGLEPQHPDLPSQENPDPAEWEAGLDQAHEPTPPRRAAPPLAASSAALRVFMGLFMSHAEAQHFCVTNAASLDRWHAAYSREFIQLAYDFAPSLRGVQKASKGLEWLLNREREWPDVLRRQYQTDLRQRASQPQAAEDPPTVGEIRVLTDGTGRSGRVIEVYPDTRQLRLQTGVDETEAIDAPWNVTQPSVRRVS